MRVSRGRKRVWGIPEGVVCEAGRYLFTVGVISALIPLYALYVYLGVMLYAF